MKKLGLIGGTGPESTVLYYRKIINQIQNKVDRHYVPSLTIENINVFEVLKMCSENNYSGLIKYLMCAINNLKASGVEVISLTGNTPHIVFDELKEKSSIPIISIVESTFKIVKEKKYKKVGLIGTIFTMNKDFFKKPFSDSNIEIIVPSEKEKEYINEKISKELELGIINKETISGFLNIINKMKIEQEIEAIILGCTELPLLFNNIKLPLETIDTVEVHINDIVKYIMKND